MTRSPTTRLIFVPCSSWCAPVGIQQAVVANYITIEPRQPCDSRLTQLKEMGRWPILRVATLRLHHEEPLSKITCKSLPCTPCCFGITEGKDPEGGVWDQQSTLFFKVYVLVWQRPFLGGKLSYLSIGFHICMTIHYVVGPASLTQKSTRWFNPV